MKKSFCIYLSAILLVFTACEDDDFGGKKNDGRIAFDIVEETTDARSRSGNVTSADTSKLSSSLSALNINGDTLFFSFREQPNANQKMLRPVKPPKSRGAAFDNDTKVIPKIISTAIVENGDGGDYYFKDLEVDIDENMHGETNHFWPNEEMAFFAHAVSKDNVTVQQLTYKRENSECSGSFSYTLPAAETEQPKDATNQPDIVFAITPDQSKQASSVPLEFHHALSAIVFKVGVMPEGVTLKSVVISNVYSSGNCTMVSTPSTDKPRDIQFTWTTTGTLGTYTETLNESAVEGNQMGGNEAMFMMIPQVMNEDTQLTLNFTLNGRDYNVIRNFKDFISEWEADKKYVFRIGLPDGIEVEVTDVVNGRRKENLKITNVGLSTAYIRAKIIGYWVVPDDLNKAEDEIEWYIVSGWKETGDGIFDWGETTSETETTHWRKHTDGYYYYMSPVVGGQDTPMPLFKSYELTSTAPVANAQLELIIAAQAVIAEEDVVNFAWPGNPIMNPTVNNE